MPFSDFSVIFLLSNFSKPEQFYVFFLNNLDIFSQKYRIFVENFRLKQGGVPNTKQQRDLFFGARITVFSSPELELQD